MRLRRIKNDDNVVSEAGEVAVAEEWSFTEHEPEYQPNGGTFNSLFEIHKHFYRKWGTWGISDRNLRAAKALGASKVVVICRKGWPGSPNKPVAWISDIDDWFARGRSRWWEGEHEMQLHLKPEEMERIPDE